MEPSNINNLFSPTDSPTTFFTYVIQQPAPSPSMHAADQWITVSRELTMDEANGVLEGYRRRNPRGTYRLIPTDWIDL